MDFSKLPRLSQTPAPPAAPKDDAAAPTNTPASPAAPILYCRCGSELARGVKFCSNCGASYGEATGTASRKGMFNSTGMPGPDAAGFQVEAFFSIAIGLFLMFLMPLGIKYWTAQIVGQPFTPYNPPPGFPFNQKVNFTRWEVPPRPDASGTVIPGYVMDIKYRDRFDHFWSDTTITAFAMALVLEGVALMLVRKRWVVLSSVVLISMAAVFNLWYVIASFVTISPITNQPYGFATFQALAAIIGCVMAGYQIRLCRDPGSI